MGSHEPTMHLVLVILFSLSTGVQSVNKGRLRIRPKEIAYGDIVDYSSMKRNYPFMSRIILDDLKCGGALISDRFVATARHCLEKCPCFNERNPSNDWTGCNNFCFVKLRENSDLEPDTETIHDIKTIHLPTNQKQTSDFALIELVRSANTCSQEETEDRRCWNIKPVKLPSPEIIIHINETVRTLGWGATDASDQSEFPVRLDVTVNSTSDQYSLETNVGPNGADPCFGDSGGPLLLRGLDHKWVIVATLYGGGFDCANFFDRSDNTSDWNRIDVHIPWIRTLIGDQTSPATSRPRPARRIIGGWSGWGSWSVCGPVTGKRKRLRRCSNPSPGKGGISCSGDNQDEETCSGMGCQIKKVYKTIYH